MGLFCRFYVIWCIKLLSPDVELSTPRKHYTSEVVRNRKRSTYFRPHKKYAENGLKLDSFIVFSNFIFVNPVFETNILMLII